MNMQLHRKPTVDGAIPGDLFVDSVRQYCALERIGVEIPTGRYRVVLTVSNRASRGLLWSPDPEHRLPELLEVPGRTGIRMHAGNAAVDSAGCILVGRIALVDEIGQSRVALKALMESLRNQVAWIEVLAAGTVQTLNV